MNTTKSAIRKPARNSIFEMFRIISLIFIFGYHWNGYAHVLPRDLIELLATFAIVMFSLLTGYFYFKSSRMITFVTKKVGNKEIIVSQNFVFRRASSRIIFWIILGNVTAIVLHYAWLHDKNIALTFEDDNWYVYSLLLVALIGVLVQKIFNLTGKNEVFYILIILGMIITIVGYYYLDLDFQFRLWRQGMMIMNLGLGWIIAKSSQKHKILLTIFLGALSALLVPLSFADLKVSHLFPYGSVKDGQLAGYVVSTFVFCLMTFINIRSHFINRVTMILQWLLETHWIAILVMRGIFQHEIINQEPTILTWGFLIGIVIASVMTIPTYFLKTFLWDKYCEKYLFCLMEYLNAFPRALCQWYDRIFVKWRVSFLKAQKVAEERNQLAKNN